MATEHYVICITLRDIDNPVITRTLSVPKTITFHKFHEAIQIAFGWASTHLYKFNVMESRRTVLVSLEERPEPTLDWLLPELPEEPKPKSTNVTLERMLDYPPYAGKPLEYLYDFGDDWEHSIKKTGTERGNGVIRCVSGSGHGVAEDCGGPHAWKQLKSVFRKVSRAADPEAAIQKLTSNEREMMEWFKDGCPNGERLGLDPDEWNIDAVNARLQISIEPDIV